jgi:hypothetical protein
MHLDAIEHANEIGDMQDSLLARQIKAEKQAASEIQELFTVTVRKVTHKHLAVPYVSYRCEMPTGRIDTNPLAEVVADVCSSGKPLDALMAVMEKSDCPLVAAWREAMAADYIYRNASDIGELTA